MLHAGLPRPVVPVASGLYAHMCDRELTPNITGLSTQDTVALVGKAEAEMADSTASEVVSGYLLSGEQLLLRGIDSNRPPIDYLESTRP
jgi:hypothetical protein